MGRSDRKLTLQALERVLGSLDAPRNGSALYALLCTFCAAGLLLASSESALAREDSFWGAVWAGLALACAFFGLNATGLMLMDQARGEPVRDILDALLDAFGRAHRVLGVLALVLCAAGGVLAALVGLLWLARQPVIGAPLFTVTVPVGVVLLGIMGLAGAVLVGPLVGPSIWSGLGVGATVRLLWRLLRRDLVECAALMLLVMALTTGVTALISFVVVGGGRVLAQLAVWIVGIDLPPQQLMAGLFGYGLRAAGAAGAPVAHSPLGAGALVGGGVVFAVALVLPTLVYLRGCCAVFLALNEAD
ncbi:MAG: hypothetical protein JO224_01640 [Pelomonas sp.]|nr:hypothetical protein [Roseateles sp.]